MKLLEAVNGILPVLGEHTVTRIDVKHPTLAVIVPNIERALKETLLLGWWFNRAKLTLYPDSEGEIALPKSMLAFLPNDDVQGSVRGKRLYNNATLSFKWSQPVQGVLTERVDFEDLPESVAMYVFYYALVTTYLTDIGLEAIVAEWKEQADSAEETAKSENLRNMRHSTRKSARYGRLTRALRG